MAVIASQLISPILWDHYAMLLLLPVAIPAGGWTVVGARDPVGDGLAACSGIERPRSSIPSRSGSPCSRRLVGRARGARAVRGLRAPRGSAWQWPPRAPEAYATPTVGPSPGSPSSRSRPCIYWLVQPPVRRGPRRLLLSRRGVPPRPQPGSTVPARARTTSSRSATVLRAVRAVPGGPADAARRGRRAGRARTRWSPDQRPARRVRRRHVLVAAGRVGVSRLGDRFLLTLLFGFSTQILWVTTRGGVWHTGHLVATILTFVCLIELYGRAARVAGRAAGRRGVPDALAAGLRRAVLRAPARARPARTRGGRRQGPRAGAGGPVADVGDVRLGVPRPLVPSSGTTRCASGRRSSRATPSRPCPPCWRRSAEQGLFSLVHIPMNLDYFLVHLPAPIPAFPFFRPDGLGLSVLLT